MGSEQTHTQSTNLTLRAMTVSINELRKAVMTNMSFFMNAGMNRSEALKASWAHARNLNLHHSKSGKKEKFMSIKSMHPIHVINSAKQLGMSVLEFVA